MYSSVGRKFRAYCSDGVTRVATTTAEPDTYFTQPARVQVKGKTVTGYISGCSTHGHYFSPNTWGKNAALMPNIGMRHYDFAECALAQ